MQSTPMGMVGYRAQTKNWCLTFIAGNEVSNTNSFFWVGSDLEKESVIFDVVPSIQHLVGDKPAKYEDWESQERNPAKKGVTLMKGGQ